MKQMWDSCIFMSAENKAKAISASCMPDNTNVTQCLCSLNK